MPGDKIEISKVNEEKFKENFDAIDWSELKDKPLEKVKNKKHVTAGLCGEYGMSTFNDKVYAENFDRIQWDKKKE